MILLCTGFGSPILLEARVFYKAINQEQKKYTVQNKAYASDKIHRKQEKFYGQAVGHLEMRIRPSDSQFFRVSHEFSSNLQMTYVIAAIVR